MSCVSDSVCELFGETIGNIFGCGCYFVVECYAVVSPSICFVYVLYVGSYLFILRV